VRSGPVRALNVANITSGSDFVSFLQLYCLGEGGALQCEIGGLVLNIVRREDFYRLFI
jgi:hypothetical protein